MSESRISHGKSTLATMEQLEAMPYPMKLGASHEPIPHYLLASALSIEAQERGYSITRAQYALGMKGSALFGVMDLMPPGVVDVTSDRGMSIGFRNSTNATLAIKVVAGTRVFVCDNLCMSGDMIAVLKRNTKNLDLLDALKHGFDQFLQHASALDLHIARLQATMISDLQAKAMVFDAFAQQVLPVHLFDDVSMAYFQPAEFPDCQPRTQWGLHNAFTRALKQLQPARAFSSNVALGKMFGLTEARS
jgi:hypothetical protein